MREKRPIIIDTDPGIDDAVALAFALFSEELEVKLITTVAGNVSCPQVTENTLKLLTFFDKEVLVAKGANQPLVQPQIDASEIHGDSGLAGFEWKEYNRQLLTEVPAAIAIHQAIQQSSEPVTLLALAPLTNIALWLRLFEEDKEKIEELVIMGGATGRGNSGNFSEFNFHADPEAAEIVLNSQLPITLLPLEIGNKARLTSETIKQVKKAGKTGKMLSQLFEHYRGGDIVTGLSMYDSTTLVYLLAPHLVETTPCQIAIELAGQVTRGASSVTFIEESSCQLVTDIQVEEFQQWFLQQVSQCG